MNRFVSATLPALVLAACSAPTSAPAPAPTGDDATLTGTGEYDGVSNKEQPADAAAPGPTAKMEADYLGKWIGVEGMYLNVASRDGGGVTLDMQWDLDHRGTFPGSVTAEGLRFTREGREEVARPTDGAATGLKWLDGKSDCLTVKPGEGYCRA